MKRLFRYEVVIAVIILALLVLVVAVDATRHVSAKRTIDQHCEVVADLRPDEVADAVKKLNAKNVRVQETQIHFADGKFYILVLDGQDDEEGGEEGEEVEKIPNK